MADTKKVDMKKMAEEAKKATESVKGSIFCKGWC